MSKKITRLKVEQVPCKDNNFKEFKITYKYNGKNIADFKTFDKELYKNKSDRQLKALIKKQLKKDLKSGKLTLYAFGFTGLASKIATIAIVATIAGAGVTAITLGILKATGAGGGGGGGGGGSTFTVTVDAVEHEGYFGEKSITKKIFNDVTKNTTFGDLTKDLANPICDIEPSDGGPNLSGNFIYYIDQDGNQLKDDYKITKDITATARYKLDECFGLENVSDKPAELQFTMVAGESYTDKATVHYARSSNLKDWNDWKFYDEIASQPGDTITINSGETVYFKSDNLNVSSRSTTWHLTLTDQSVDAKILAHGDIMALIDDGACDSVEIPMSYCFNKLFDGFAQLDLAEDFVLPATLLKTGCYAYMFQDCTSITHAPDLPANLLFSSCYGSMFRGCVNLINPSEFGGGNNVNIDEDNGNGVFQDMFRGCSKLDHIPDLSKIVIPDVIGKTTASIFVNMFMDCTTLTSVPAEKMIICSSARSTLMCWKMFYGCTGIVSADISNITGFGANCFDEMFTNCSSLNYLKVGFGTPGSAVWPDISGESFTDDWLSEVSNTGTFIWNGEIPTVRGVNTVPENWEVNP